MKHDGWQITDDGVLPPVPAGTPPPGASAAPAAPSMVPVAVTATMEGNIAEKRELDAGEHGDDDDAPPAKKAA
jgi:RNA exonuclease 1